MPNSTEHEISTAHKNYMAENKDVKFLISNSLRVVFYHAYYYYRFGQTKFLSVKIHQFEHMF